MEKGRSLSWIQAHQMPPPCHFCIVLFGPLFASPSPSKGHPEPPTLPHHWLYNRSQFVVTTGVLLPPVPVQREGAALPFGAEEDFVQKQEVAQGMGLVPFHPL